MIKLFLDIYREAYFTSASWYTDEVWYTAGGLTGTAANFVSSPFSINLACSSLRNIGFLK